MYLDIFSDTICPWCFVGKRRLERALAQRPQPGLQIRWRAFQLNPTMPAEGMDRRLYIESKFGNADRAQRIYDSVGRAGQGEGIAFAFDKIRRTPNTIMSHRLAHYAARGHRQNEMIEALFRAYFQEGALIGEIEGLVAIAAEIGYDPVEVRLYLEGDEDREDILAEDQLARRMGIGGVPCFIFNGRFALSGAQEPEAFFQMFDLAREDDAEKARETADA